MATVWHNFFIHQWVDHLKQHVAHRRRRKYNPVLFGNRAFVLQHVTASEPGKKKKKCDDVQISLTYSELSQGHADKLYISYNICTLFECNGANTAEKSQDWDMIILVCTLLSLMCPYFQRRTSLFLWGHSVEMCRMWLCCPAGIRMEAADDVPKPACALYNSWLDELDAETDCGFCECL